MSKELAKLTRKADAVAISASRLLSEQIKTVQGEIASLSQKLNIAGSAKDREAVYEAVRKRMRQLSKKLDNLLSAQNELAAKTAAKEASRMTGLEIKYSAKRAEAITELVTPAQGENLAAVFTERMSQHLINSLRSATVEALREQAVAGGTLKELSKELAWKWIAKSKEPPVFVDAGGKAWNTATYFQMQARTNSMRIYNDCLIDDVARETGSDLMRISRGGDPNCHCFAWEGCIISISGKTKGLPTYEQARNGGCFHPNCTHTLEYVDEVVDADEIALAKKHPMKGEGIDADEQYDRRRQIDIDRKMHGNASLSRQDAELAVDRDNLTSAIRNGLVRSDARDLVDGLTDAQVKALVKDGRTPRFEPFKATKKELKDGAKERWNHGSRGGVVYIKRDASAEDLVRVTRLEEVKEPVIASPKADNTIPDGKKLADNYQTKTHHITEESDPKALAKAIDDVGKRIRDFDVEHMVVLNPDGTHRFDEFISTPNGGPIPNQWKGNLKGATLIHNHPGLGDGLSDKDIFTARLENLRTIQAVSKRATYTLTVDNWPPMKKLQATWDKVDSEVTEELSKSNFSIMERMLVVQDCVVSRLAKELNFLYDSVRL